VTVLTMDGLPRCVHGQRRADGVVGGGRDRNADYVGGRSRRRRSAASPSRFTVHSRPSLISLILGGGRHGRGAMKVIATGRAPGAHRNSLKHGARSAETLA
jgi:hypothetical protein